jgi:REP element-mobilizing transposase RayT
MGRSRYKIYNTEVPHFLTMTIVDWLPIFANREIADIILDSLRYLQEEKKAKLYAYVIMENHFHCIVQSDELRRVIQSFKSYTARAIIDYFTEQKNTDILKKLRQNKLSHKTASEYQVWQEGNHPEEITTDEMMHQKLEYIHNNPVRRGYIEESSYWRYSSAQNYEGKKGLINVEMEW